MAGLTDGVRLFPELIEVKKVNRRLALHVEGLEARVLQSVSAMAKAPSLTPFDGAQSPIAITNFDGITLLPGGTIDFGNYVNLLTTQAITKVIQIEDTSNVSIVIHAGLAGSGTTPFLFGVPDDGATYSRTLQPGESVFANIVLDLRGGTYSLGTLSESLLIAPVDATTNTLYPQQTYTVEADVISQPPRIATTITVTSGSAKTYNDANGNKVKVRLSGPGTAMLGFGTTGNANLKDLTLSDTTAASALSITPLAGKRTTIIGNIDVTGFLGKLSAPRVNLAGDGFSNTGNTFQASDGLAILTLGNITGLEAISIAGTGHTGLQFTAGSVADATLSSNEPLASVHVASWTDSHVFDEVLLVQGKTEQLSAPSIANLRCAGDFTMGVNIGAGGSISNAAITGSLGSDPWIVAGNLNNFHAGAVPLGFSASVGGTVNVMNVTHDYAGTIAAGNMGHVKVGGNINQGKLLAGVNLGADGKIGGTGSDQDTYAAGVIDSLFVNRAGGSAFVSAGFQPADGLFDDGTGSIIGGPASIIRNIYFRDNIDVATEFVAGKYGIARLPHKIDPAKDFHFIVL